MERSLHTVDLANERMDLVDIFHECVYVLHPSLRGSFVRVKAYENLPHGSTGAEVVLDLPFKNLRENIASFRLDIHKTKEWTTWQTGVSGVLYFDGEPKYCLPMLDLEYPSTANLSRDLDELAPFLDKLGIEGGIFRSGDSGRGGYFFVGYNPVEYEPNYWKFLGKSLSVLNYGDSENAEIARVLGDLLMAQENIESAKTIAKDILFKFPSIKNGESRHGLVVDPRWIAHRILQGFSILRCSPGKSYDDKPLQVAWMCNN